MACIDPTLGHDRLGHNIQCSLIMRFVFITIYGEYILWVFRRQLTMPHGQFSPKYTQYTPNSLPMRLRYRLLFVRPQCGFHFTFVILVWAISSHTGQCSVLYRARGLVPKVSENSKFVWDLPKLKKKIREPLHPWTEISDKHFITHFEHPMFYITIGYPSWWSHQMETFSALLAICAGNSPVPGEFPTQRPVTRSFDVFFDLRLNLRLIWDAIVPIMTSL